MPTPALTDEQCLEALKHESEHRRLDHACEALGEVLRARGEKAISVNAFSHRCNTGRSRGLHLSDGARSSMQSAGLTGAEIKGGWIHSYDDEGKKIGTNRWSVPEVAIEDDTLNRIADRMSRVVAAPAIKRPKHTRSDVMNFCPKYDVHLGQRTGGFGTAAAVARLKEGFQDVIDRAPLAETCVIVNGGDFTELMTIPP